MLIVPAGVGQQFSPQRGGRQGENAERILRKTQVPYAAGLRQPRNGKEGKRLLYICKCIFPSSWSYIWFTVKQENFTCKVFFHYFC